MSRKPKKVTLSFSQGGKPQNYLEKNILGGFFFFPGKFLALGDQNKSSETNAKEFWEKKKKNKEKKKVPKFTNFEEFVSDIIAISVQ